MPSLNKPLNTRLLWFACGVFFLLAGGFGLIQVRVLNQPVPMLDPGIVDITQALSIVLGLILIAVSRRKK